MSTLRAILAIPLLMSPAVVAQVQWEAIQPSGGPPATMDHAMTFDPNTGEVLLFGGFAEAAYAYSDETWTWNGTRWARRNPPVRPSPRGNFAMALDPVRGRVVLHGGRDAATIALSDTWEWDGASWSRIGGASGPVVRHTHQLAWDGNRGRLILFGGSTGVSAYPNHDDTWEWDGASWQRLQPPTSPPAHSMHAMAWDAFRRRVVVWGGWAPTYKSTDTWEWDGQTWALVNTPTRPQGRVAPELVYDAARQRIVLLGGSTGSIHPSFDRTWEYEGSDWIERRPPLYPPDRLRFAAAHDPLRRETVIHGGSSYGVLADLWEYGPVFPARHESYGAGCTGIQGIPHLVPLGSHLPWRGAPFTLELSNVGQARFAFILLGYFADRWGGLGLPLALDGVGMPGCELHLVPCLQTHVDTATGSATWTAWLCNDPVLLGQAFYNQALCADPAANFFGAVLSNATRSVVGGK